MTQFVADHLARHHERRMSDVGYDDFKVEFKNQPALRTLTKDVVGAYVSAEV